MRTIAQRTLLAFAAIALGLVQPHVSEAVAQDVGTLIQTIDTSQLSPPSPDSSGLTYLPLPGTILMSDSEVNEIPSLFTGDNLFELSLDGILIGTGSTITHPDGDEPTGLAFDPFSGLLFISDDSGPRGVHVVDPGSDGDWGTPDDVVTFLETRDFNATDPEGVAFDPLRGLLYVVDGVNAEVYEIDPGINGLFDGVPPAGDDVVTSFDTARLGVLDPEGITFSTDDNSLYIIGNPADLLSQVSVSGSLMRTIDVSSAAPYKPAGLAYAPSSQTPSEMNIYIADRGVDNNSDPNENDGKIYEFSIPYVTPGNAPPTVDAGPDQSITLPAIASLDGTVSDDGIPGPLTTTWAHVGGIGTVTFADASAVDTTVSFSEPGTYDLRLTANDGELSTSDYVTVTVLGPGGELVVESRVSAGSDDAEEYSDGSLSLGSSDLELVYDGGGNQTVGMRFNNVGIPQGATIASAFVQFQVDEVKDVDTLLTIRGEDIDNAPTFVGATGEISSRSLTTASVSWAPIPWTIVGEAGPDQRTSDIAPIIQEIVNRPGWASGNSMLIIVSGTGERVAESYDGDVNGAPLLHVDLGSGPVNTVPSVTITTPADGTGVNEGDSVAFTGTASDAEDGDLTAALAWSSSIDGPLGTGPSIARMLSTGTHTISASATDSSSATGNAFIMVTVNASPIVTITGPADGTIVNAGDRVTFSGTASDAEDGNLAQGLNWSSSLDGVFGSGKRFSTTALSAGVHRVAASVTDSDGLLGSDEIIITISELDNVPPVANAGGPYSGTAGVAVSFDGSLSSDSDGTIVSYAWVFGDGSTGTGATPTHSYVAAASYTVSLTVTDDDGATNTATTTATIAEREISVVSVGYASSGGKNSDKHLDVTITLVDGSGAAVAGAALSATITGPNYFSVNYTGVTDAAGGVTFRVRNTAPGTYSTEVTDVTAAGSVWDGATPPNSFTK